MPKIKIVALLVVFSTQCYSQDYRKQQNEILVFNVLSDGLISGVASTFNKKEDEKFLPVFARNFGKGCLGGLVKYMAKYQTFYLKSQQNIHMAPVNRALFFLGHSMSQNASMNERLLENYYFNLYGLNFNYSPYREKGDRFKTRLSIGTLASVIYLYGRGDRIDFYKTLEYGQFYLDLNDEANFQGNLIGGRAMYNAFSIRTNGNGAAAQHVVPHELIHTYQNYNYFGVSSIYRKRLETVLNKSKIYQIVTRFVDLDYEPLFFTTAYQLQPEPRYYRNFFEYEAQHFSTRMYIDR